MNKMIPIVVSFDKNYLIPALITIKSIIKTCSEPSKIEFFVLHRGLGEDKRALVEKIVYTYGCFVTFIDCEKDFKDITYRQERSVEIFMMLLVPRYFKHYEKVVVLDTDMLIRDDILKTVYDLPDDKKLGAVKCMLRRIERAEDGLGYNFYSKNVIGIKKPENYFNGGFVVFNMKNVTEEDAEKCISLLSKRWQSNEEAILNFVFQDSLHLYPIRWNFYVSYFYDPDNIFAEDIRTQVSEAKENAAICHFISDSKPWKITTVDRDNQYRVEYRKIWYGVKKDISAIAPFILTGKMWNIMGNV